MKTIFVSLIAIGVIVFSSCGSNTANQHEGHDMSKMGTDTTAAVNTASDDSTIKKTGITFSNTDPVAVAAIKEMVDHYLHIKNALANDDAKEAASGAEALYAVIKKMDKSLFTAEQKKVYDGIEEGINEDAEHISKNADKIEHQRTHFASLSDDMYTLVKAFGGGRALYYDHCPMAKNNQGANWISESKEVKNPYFGSKMPTCGTVEEIIQ